MTVPPTEACLCKLCALADHHDRWFQLATSPPPISLSAVTATTCNHSCSTHVAHLPLVIKPRKPLDVSTNLSQMSSEISTIRRITFSASFASNGHVADDVLVPAGDTKTQSRATMANSTTSRFAIIRPAGGGRKTTSNLPQLEVFLHDAPPFLVVFPARHSRCHGHCTKHPHAYLLLNARVVHDGGTAHGSLTATTSVDKFRGPARVRGTDILPRRRSWANSRG
jgi:hypothetical protein